MEKQVEDEAAVWLWEMSFTGTRDVFSGLCIKTYTTYSWPLFYQVLYFHRFISDILCNWGARLSAEKQNCTHTSVSLPSCRTFSLLHDLWQGFYSCFCNMHQTGYVSEDNCHTSVFEKPRQVRGLPNDCGLRCVVFCSFTTHGRKC